MKKESTVSYASGKIGRFFDALFSGHSGRALGIAGRYLMLPPMALAMVILLVSQDALTRIGALICLVFMEQIRDMWTFRELEAATGKGRKE